MWKKDSTDTKHNKSSAETREFYEKRIAAEAKIEPTEKLQV